MEKSNSSGDRYRTCIVMYTHTHIRDGINAIPSLATSAKARVSLIIGRRAAPLSGKLSFVAGFARLNSPHIPDDFNGRRSQFNGVPRGERGKGGRGAKRARQ